MTKTAVGLFENPGSVDEVVRDLVAIGFPQNDIRILREPEEMVGSGIMSIPHTDFEVDLLRELRTIGAAEAARKLTSRVYGAEESCFSQRVRTRRQTRLLRL